MNGMVIPFLFAAGVLVYSLSILHKRCNKYKEVDVEFNWDYSEDNTKASMWNDGKKITLTRMNGMPMVTCTITSKEKDVIKAKGIYYNKKNGCEKCEIVIIGDKVTVDKEKTDISIRQAKLEDLKDIIRLMYDKIGENFLTDKEVIEYIEGIIGKICLVAEHDGKIEGFSIGEYNEIKAIKGISESDDSIKREKGIQGSIGEIIDIVTEDDNNWSLVGDMLGQRMYSILEELGAEIITCYARGKDEKVRNANILSSIGLLCKAEVKNYWTDKSVKEGFKCRLCDGECHCSAYIYVNNKKEVKEE